MMSFQHMLSAGSKKISKTSSSLEETAEIGRSIARDLAPGAIVAFFGDLGAGKTTLIKSLASGLTGIDPHEVSSPTFTYLHIYKGTCPVYHFDLYRLKNAADFLARGFDEYFDAGGICLIEWAERIDPILPEHTQRLEIKHLDENKRTFTFL
ncbi:tRNA (adenosine(37)-N6)-threonylcarbamoyltransferase complex ATPase subunit type 1 TsaE [Simkania sp.]|uniref:tRNA (adenosine(37)-N6)-threonylcarbamoyltransferase complex ATPase subunit type 1 TsaE n=1 Tax=Simkania sp. TaxID=34094 RepID=UPI003B52EA7E